MVLIGFLNVINFWILIGEVGSNLTNYTTRRYWIADLPYYLLICDVSLESFAVVNACVLGLLLIFCWND